jgi:hypothetical protein
MLVAPMGVGDIVPVGGGVAVGVKVAVGVEVGVRVAVGVWVGLGVLLGLGAASTLAGPPAKRDASRNRILTLRPYLNENIFIRLSSFLSGSLILQPACLCISDAIGCSEQTDSYYSSWYQERIRIFCRGVPNIESILSF